MFKYYKNCFKFNYFILTVKETFKQQKLSTVIPIEIVRHASDGEDEIRRIVVLMNN